MNRPCPPADQLIQLATGKLPDPPAMDIESHVLECPECQKVTASFKVGDTFVDHVRQAARQTPDPRSALDPADQARVQRIIAQASGLRPKAADTQLSDATIAPSHGDVLAELARAWQPPQQPDELGRLGGYRILRLLGAGGMGAVLLGEDAQLDRQVALKVMRPQAAADPAAAERFLREARAAAAVRHDNVVTIYQVGQDQSVPFIAQELLVGETLEDRLKRERRLPVSEAVAIARQIAAGLSAAHARGLMHRDIKPANAWLEPADANGPPRVKLLDFGLARSYADDAVQLTQAGMIVGTPAYMAPEQAPASRWMRGPTSSAWELFCTECSRALRHSTSQTRWPRCKPWPWKRRRRPARSSQAFLPSCPRSSCASLRNHQTNAQPAPSTSPKC